MTAIAKAPIASPQAIVERVLHSWADNADVSPAEVAEIAYREPEIDPDEIAPGICPWLVKMQLRDIARSILRKYYPSDQLVEQHSLFPNIQPKYPKIHREGEDFAYTPVENMTKEDYLWNIAQLRTSAAARLKHADALEQHGIMVGIL